MTNKELIISFLKKHNYNSKQELKQSLDNEEYDLISKTDDNEISFKFKIVELFQNWRLGNK